MLHYDLLAIFKVDINLYNTNRPPSQLSLLDWTTYPRWSCPEFWKNTRRHDHGYNFTFRNSTAILNNDDADDARYAPYDHEDDDEYPSLHHDGIIYPDISGVDDNINDDDADSNTDDANNNADNTNAHYDADININNNDEPNTNCDDTNNNIDVL